MRKTLGILLLSCSALVTNHARAGEPSGSQSSGDSWQQQIDDWADQYGPQFESWVDNLLGVQDSDAGSPGVVAAPEFDPSSAIAAFTLLAGGLVLVRGRRKAK